MTGLDSETHNGKCVLLATPEAFIEPWAMRNEDRFLKICEWLQGIDKKEGFVCWNADFDVQAILKWLPRSICERLQRFTRAVYKDIYYLRFVPGKFFTVHRWTGRIRYNRKTKKREKVKTRLVVIFDLMQFYGERLETASQKLLGEGKKDPGIPWDELLAALKSRKNPVLREQIIDYCKFDASLVERLYHKSRENMERIGVRLNRPVSCASIASQKFGKLFEHTIPKEINRAFERTYRGGRMECLRVGFFPRAYLYDVHSAYPSAIAELKKLPDHWEKITSTKGVRADAIFAAVKCKFRIPEIATGPISVHGDGQLMYPVGVWSQWLDLQTYRLLEARGWVKDVIRGWQGVGGNKERPFSVIEDMYQERINTPENSWAIKILLNSWYGKLAETIKRWGVTGIIPIHGGDVEAWGGRFWRRRVQWTKKTCFVYAAAITAALRYRMFTEIDPAKAIFYATDGVALTEPDNRLLTGPGLGEWSTVEEVRDLLVVGSGVYCYRYFDAKKQEWKIRTKFRGFDSSLNLYELLDSNKRILTMMVKRNMTLTHALTRRQWAKFNVIDDVPRLLDVNFDRKRRWDGKRTGRKLLHGQFESEPWGYYGPIKLTV